MIRQLPRVVLIILLVFASIGVVGQQASSPAKAPATKTKRAPLTPPSSLEFSEGVARQIMGLIRDGLQNHSPSRMLAAFDRENLPDYLAFEDQVHSYFNQHDSFRSYFRILQTSTEGTHGVVLAVWQVEAVRSSSRPPDRQDGQVRFELAPGKHGWQIVQMTPRDFFQ